MFPLWQMLSQAQCIMGHKALLIKLWPLANKNNTRTDEVQQTSPRPASRDETLKEATMMMMSVFPSRSSSLCTDPVHVSSLVRLSPHDLGWGSWPEETPGQGGASSSGFMPVWCRLICLFVFSSFHRSDLISAVSEQGHFRTQKVFTRTKILTWHLTLALFLSFQCVDKHINEYCYIELTMKANCSSVRQLTMKKYMGRMSEYLNLEPAGGCWGGDGGAEIEWSCAMLLCHRQTKRMMGK